MSFDAVADGGVGHARSRGQGSGVSGALVYTPVASYHGQDSFSYRVNDGTTDSNIATVNLNVMSVNDAPIAARDDYFTSLGAALTVPSLQGLLGNDHDVDGQPLTAKLFTRPKVGTLNLMSDGSFTYVPPQKFSGKVTFSYRAFDGTSFSKPVQVTIDVKSL